MWQQTIPSLQFKRMQGNWTQQPGPATLSQRIGLGAADTLAVLFVLLNFQSICQGKTPPPSPTPPAASKFSPPRVEQVPQTSPAYRLSTGDTIQIHVFHEDELNTTARIGKDGSIPFPLICSIQVGGRNVSETAAALAQALREYLVRPQVAIRIIDYSKRRFTILGQVNRPGTFDMPDETTLTLLEAIGMAGGYSRVANPSKVIVKRTTQEGEQVFKIDAKQMAKGQNAPSFSLLPGDTVVVEESLF